MSRWLRRIGYFVGTLVLLLAVLAGFAYMKSSQIVSKKYAIHQESVAISSDSATLARGEHLVKAIAKCDDCHSSDFGGKLFLDAMPFARLYSPNITRGEGGMGTAYTDAQFATVIRHGVKADSTTAIIMPSDAYQELSDEDVGAIIAYIRAQPPINRSHPKPQLGPIARGLAAAGKLTFFMADYVPPDRPHVASVTPDSTVEYGKYLSIIGGCTSCHGPGLGGGNRPDEPPEWPQSSNLTPTGIGHYTDAQLEAVMRTGKRPDGSQLKNPMPWQAIAQLTDVEMSATIKYLRSVPAKPFGTR